MKKNLGDIFLVVGVVVGIAAACYVIYFVWNMNWGAGSRNKGFGWAFLFFLPLASFGISVFVFGLLGSYLERFR
jgi:hypothetical protein